MLGLRLLVLVILVRSRPLLAYTIKTLGGCNLPVSLRKSLASSLPPSPSASPLSYPPLVLSASTSSSFDGRRGGEDGGPADQFSRGGQPLPPAFAFRGVRTTLSEIDPGGRLVRSPGRYRSWIGPGSRFLPQEGRYHLYVSLACPWSCRVLSVLSMKGLDNIIGVSIVHPTWQRTRPKDELDSHVGWVFRHPDDPPVRSLAFGGGGSGKPQAYDCKGCIPDWVNEARTIREIYELSGDKDGKYTVPLLWDKQSGRIVNNESADLMRMLATSFNHLAGHPHLDLCPGDLLPAIDRANDWIYHAINDGVYKCAFAKTQRAYDEAATALFQGLDRAESLLAGQRYLTGSRFTEADIRLFQSLVRFDDVYSIFAKCSRKRIVDYPNLLNFAREVYQLPAMSHAVNMEHITRHYWSSYWSVSPNGIIPRVSAFIQLLYEAHDRQRLPGEQHVLC